MMIISEPSPAPRLRLAEEIIRRALSLAALEARALLSSFHSVSFRFISFRQVAGNQDWAQFILLGLFAALTLN